jgi:hypothetical protein
LDSHDRSFRQPPFGSRLDGYPPLADNDGKWS